MNIPTPNDYRVIEARAELSLLIRYADEGVTIRKEHIERVLDLVKSLPLTFERKGEVA